MYLKGSLCMILRLSTVIAEKKHLYLYLQLFLFVHTCNYYYYFVFLSIELSLFYIGCGSNYRTATILWDMMPYSCIMRQHEPKRKAVSAYQVFYRDYVTFKGSVVYKNENTAAVMIHVLFATWVISFKTKFPLP